MDWTEKKFQSTSQSQLCIRKRSWSLFGGLLPSWSTNAFWIQVKPLHLRSMLNKSKRCIENCNAYNWHWSIEWAQQFSKQCPTTHGTTNASKVEWIWLWSFGLISHIHLNSRQLTTTSSSISMTFFRENTFTTSRMQKMLSKSLSNPEAQIFILQG